MGGRRCEELHHAGHETAAQHGECKAGMQAGRGGRFGARKIVVVLRVDNPDRSAALEHATRQPFPDREH